MLMDDEDVMVTREVKMVTDGDDNNNDGCHGDDDDDGMCCVDDYGNPGDSEPGSYNGDGYSDIEFNKSYDKNTYDEYINIIMETKIQMIPSL